MQEPLPLQTPPGDEGSLRVPTRPVSLLFQLALCLTNLVVWLAIIPFQQLLLPAQVAQLDPINKNSTLSVVVLLSGLAAFISQIASGAVSDRITSRFGRRRPLMVLGAILTLLVAALLAQASSIAIIIVGYVLFGIVIDMILTPLVALIPDQVPVRQRATVSAFVGFAQPLGTLFGVLLIAQVIKSIPLSYYIVGGLVCIVILPFALIVHDEPFPKDAVSPFAFGPFLRGFVTPLGARDFRLTWIARFLVILAQQVVLIFMLNYLHDVVRYSQLFPGQTDQQGVSLFTSIYTVSLLLFALGSGWLSDRVQKRKPFVIAASLMMAIATGLLALIPAWQTVLFVGALFGAGFGMFASSDVALATQVLPNQSDRGKDMGLILAAGALPALLFPLLSFVAFGLLNGYPALFGIAAVASACGAFFIFWIKSVR